MSSDKTSLAASSEVSDLPGRPLVSAAGNRGQRRRRAGQAQQRFCGPANVDVADDPAVDEADTFSSPSASAESRSGGVSRRSSNISGPASSAISSASRRSARPDYVAVLAARRTVWVAAGEEPALIFAKKMNIPCEVKTGRNVNPHQVAAMVRMAAYYRMLRAVGVGKTHLSVCSWYGADRDVIKLCARPGTPSLVDVQCVYEETVAGDAAREFVGRTQMCWEAEWDVGWICDVYQEGPNSLAPLSVSLVKRLCERMRTRRVYALLRRFRGAAGCDVFPTGKPKPDDLHVEGAWFRDPTGMIVFFPEPGAMPYAPHPDIPWLGERHVDGLDISEIQDFITHVLYCFSLNEAFDVELQPAPKLEPTLSSWTIEVPSRWDWLRKWFNKPRDTITVLADRRAVVSVGPAGFALKPVTGPLVEVVERRVRAAMQDIPEWRGLLAHSFGPLLFESALFGSMQVVLYASRELLVSRVYSLRLGFAEVDHKLGAARKTELPVVPPLCTPHQLVTVGGGVLGALAVSAIGWRIFRYFRPQPLLAIVSTRLRWQVGVLGFWMYAAFLKCARLPSCVANNRAVALVMGAMPFSPGRRSATFMTEWLDARSRMEIRDDLDEGVFSLRPDETIPSTVASTTIITHALRGNLDVVFTGDTRSYSLTEALMVAGTESNNVIYPIVVTSGLLFEPAKCDRNHLLAIAMRLLKYPFPADAPPPQERWDRWRALTTAAVHEGLFTSSYGPLPDMRVEGKRIFVEMGAKGKRFLAAMDREEAGYTNPDNPVVNLKWNELLPPKEGDLKPRTIVSIHESKLKDTVPWAHYLAGLVHECFDTSPRAWAGVPVICIWASGATAEDLASYGELLAGGQCVVVVVAGDDSLIFWGPLTPLAGAPYMEGDQSAFDHTQDEGPLIHAANVWMPVMGVPPDIITTLQSFIPSRFIVRTRTMFATGAAGAQMPTGTSVTSVQSSVHTILMYYYFVTKLVAREGPPDFQGWAAELGFKMKCKMSDCLTDTTFLRGWWHPTLDGRWGWAPLPSLVVKLGKLLRPPEDCFRPRMKSRPAAMLTVLHALARSMKGVARDYPILGAFLRMCDRVGTGSRHLPSLGDLDPDFMYKAYHLGTPVDRSAVVESVFRRYGLGSNDILGVERLFDQVVDVPVVVSSPVFARLVEVDYA